VERGGTVLFDTNIIIECFRAGCWKAICAHFSVESVKTCFDEALAGNKQAAGYIKVDEELLRNGLKNCHQVSDLQRVEFNLRSAWGDSIDAGELDLFAYALSNKGAWMVACADRAAVRVALELGWADRFVSLESLARASGVKQRLYEQFSESWLAQVRTQFALGRL
jgi:hypothetical protein